MYLILFFVFIFITIMWICIFLFCFSRCAHKSGPDNVDEDIAAEDDRGEDDNIEVGGEIADYHGEL